MKKYKYIEKKFSKQPKVLVRIENTSMNSGVTLCTYIVAPCPLTRTSNEDPASSSDIFGIQTVVLKYRLTGTRTSWRNGYSGSETENEGLEEKPGIFHHTA